MKRPEVIPLFPLPGVVLFPEVLLPLHIFEVRYRALVCDVSERGEWDGLIGIVLRKEGVDEPTWSTGCAGKLIRKVDLPDGRSNILLRGVSAFRLLARFDDRPYRTGRIEWLDCGTTIDGQLRDELRAVSRVFLDEKAAGLEWLEDETLSDRVLVHGLAFALGLPAIERQALLEMHGLEERTRGLLDILRFHLEERRLCVPGDRAGHRSQ